MGELVNASVIGRLLEAISWEGRNVRAYRQGGRGVENVLTAEVLLPLSYLPRDAFLGAVLAGAYGATRPLADLARDIEQADVWSWSAAAWRRPGARTTLIIVLSR
jgi:hypothetical protein